MDLRCDVMENFDNDELRLLDLLCEKNIAEAKPEEEVLLDLLCKKNEEHDLTQKSSLDMLMETFESNQDDIIGSADAKVLQDIHKEMLHELHEVDGGWHNQEYSMAEVERRIKERTQKQ